MAKKDEAQEVKEQPKEKVDPEVTVTVIIADETKVFEGLRSKSTRRARAFIRGHGLTITQADNKEEDEQGNLLWQFNQPSAKQLERKAKAEAKAKLEAEEAAAKEEEPTPEAEPATEGWD